MKNFLDWLLSFLKGEASGMLSEVKSTVRDTMDHAERKIEQVTAKAIKASVVFVLVFIGLIFIFVGASQYITEVFSLKEGIGHGIVGLTLLLLGVFAKAIRS